MHLPLVLSTLAALALSAPTVTPRTCPSTIIHDGGFESGTTPPTSGGNAWTVTTFLGSSTYALTKPGSTNNGGKYAFTAILYPGPYSPTSGETLTQTLSTCAGKNYSITADYKFSTQANGECAIKVEYPFKDTRGSVTTGSAISPAGVWYTTGMFCSLCLCYRAGNGCRSLLQDQRSRRCPRPVGWMSCSAARIERIIGSASIM